MRNFKKFLALVLAMLMVSACAVSVAAFNDQEKIDKNFSQYKNAIAMLEELGVVQGDENKNYNPEKTLTRAEAAVIIAKLVAGAAGQSMDWTAETTKFADVDAKWSFAYINYVADRKIMVGTDLGFEPNRELKIDEALTLALKAVDPAELRAVEILYAQAPTAYWGTYYINAAEELGLTVGLETIYDPEAACSRAMFAQVAYNMVNFEKDPTPDNTTNNDAFKPIGDGFGYATVTTTIKSVDAANGIVKLADSTIPEIKLDAFNAALKDAGVEKTAADLVNYKISMQWSTKTFAIYGIEVLTKIDTYTYATDAIKYVPTAADPNAVEGKKLEINGKIYDIDDDDKAAGAITQIGGSSAADTNNIRIYNNPIKTSALKEITTVVKDETIPAFYTVDCYDDNGDGDYERAYVTEYLLVTFTKSATKVNHDHKDTTDPLNATVVKVFAENGSTATKFVRDDRYLTVDGAGYTAWGETPVLANIIVVDPENISAKILDTAKTVTGVVDSIKTDKYIVIDEKQIDFAAGYADPANWILSQNVTVYTINDKFVAVASADTGVESGMVEKTILVDKVVVDNGVAVVSGFYHGAAFEAVTLKLVGVVDANGKLMARNAYYDDKVAKDWNVDGNKDAGDTELYAVALGTNKKDDKTIENAVVIADNTFYDVVVTSAGAYLVGKDVVVDGATKYDWVASAKTFPAATANGTAKVSISGSYIKVDTTAEYRLADSFVVVTKKEMSTADKAKAHGYYDEVSYVTATTIPANDTIKYGVVDADFAVVDNTNKNTKNVSLIYIDTITETEVEKKVETLAEGMTIVKILELESAALAYNTYKAFDIFTGAEVYVTGNGAADNSYATVVDGKIVTNNTQWIGTFAVTGVETLGKIESVYAYNCYLAGEKDGEAIRTFITGDDKKVAFGLDNVTVYKYDTNGKLVVNTEPTYAANTNDMFGFINGGKVVILPN